MPFKVTEVSAKLQRAGFEIKRQSGSHVVLRHPDGRQTYVAMHTRDIPLGTLKILLRHARLSMINFSALQLTPR